MHSVSKLLRVAHFAALFHFMGGGNAETTCGSRFLFEGVVAAYVRDGEDYMGKRRRKGLPLVEFPLNEMDV